MATHVSQPGHRSGQLWARARQVLLILAAVLLVVAILFVIVYGMGIRHHHSSTNHRAVPTVFTR